jgi:cytochrome c oxidase cbb3-type subunit III
MSDFNSSFWSWFVAGISVVSIIACFVLFWLTSRAQTDPTTTTGHVWDEDLQEMNTPMPRWWAGLFVLTIVFSLLYLAFYPGLGTFKGSLGWSSTGEHDAEAKVISQQAEKLMAAYIQQPVEQIAKNQAALGVGERLFLNNCAQCHGSDAKGARGFPNLSDNDWLHGGSPDKITESIAKGRNGAMPPMGAAVGSAEQVKNLSHYVLSLSGSPHDSVRAGLGKASFTACAACHGMDGKGNAALGAPNLADNVWLHGYGEARITEIINQGKTNVMPAMGTKLSESQVKILTAYVWSLSNK